MPTILRQGPYRFFFYAGDRHEPRHVHVEHDASTAKYWLQPIRLAHSRGFKSHELNAIRTIIEDNEADFQESWDDYFAG